MPATLRREQQQKQQQTRQQRCDDNDGSSDREYTVCERTQGGTRWSRNDSRAPGSPAAAGTPVAANDVQYFTNACANARSSDDHSAISRSNRNTSSEPWKQPLFGTNSCRGQGSRYHSTQRVRTAMTTLQRQSLVRHAVGAARTCTTSSVWLKKYTYIGAGLGRFARLSTIHFADWRAGQVICGAMLNTRRASTCDRYDINCKSTDESSHSAEAHLPSRHQ
jgi:hypothetical protein